MVKRKEKANEILRKDEIIMDKKEEKLEGQELEEQQLEDQTRDLPKDKKEAKENESEEAVEEITTFFELDFSNTTTNGLKTEKAKLEDGKLVVIAVAI